MSSFIASGAWSMAFGRFAAKPLARTLDWLARAWRSALTLYRVVVRPGMVEI